MKTLLSWFFIILAFIFAGLAWLALAYNSNWAAGFFYSILGAASVIVSDFFGEGEP